MQYVARMNNGMLQMFGINNCSGDLGVSVSDILGFTACLQLIRQTTECPIALVLYLHRDEVDIRLSKLGLQMDTTGGGVR